MNLEDFKYDFNLVTTHSGSGFDRCLVNYTRDENKINYDNLKYYKTILLTLKSTKK